MLTPELFLKPLLLGNCRLGSPSCTLGRELVLGCLIGIFVSSPPCLMAKVWISVVPLGRGAVPCRVTDGMGQSDPGQ